MIVIRKMYKDSLLFLDDESAVLNSINRIFLNEKYNLFLAETSKKAFEILKNYEIGVVVSDIRMPDMNGFEFLEQVKKDYPKSIRIILSSIENKKAVLEALNKSNVYRYITKPWDNDELKTIVEQSFEVYNLQKSKQQFIESLFEQNELLKEEVKRRTEQILSMERFSEIGKYASSIVHNFNGQLQIINSAVNLAEMDYESAPSEFDSDKHFNRIKKAIIDLSEIIKGILNQARNKETVEHQSVDINKIIREEIRFYDINDEFKHKTTKEVELTENVPLIEANPIQLKQIIDNLIKNSIEAMRDIQNKKIFFKTHYDTNFVYIEIQDSGCGITKENINKIFSPDFTTKPIGQGTGLGLASVKTMIESYSGKIEVSSEINKKTHFKISLPRKKDIFENE